MTLQEQVMKNFFTPDGRLKRIPVKRSKQEIVLACLAEQFEMGVQYPEKAVNAVILRFHEDFATLRRALVDGRFMARENGVYWRLEPK